jgi:hypothetical protein
MLEFKSETSQPSLLFKLAIALSVLAVAAVAIFVYVRYQEGTQADAGRAPVAIPGILRPGDTNFEYYKHRIRIENPKASLGITFSQARIAIISGLISNEGDRTVEALELHITLYDVYDQFSKSRVALPIRPGIGWATRPLEPLEKRTFSVGIESVEQLWNPRKLEIKITGLKYK